MSKGTTNSSKEQNQAQSENVFYDPFGTPGFQPAFFVPAPTSKSGTYFEGYSPSVGNGNPLFANQAIFNPYLYPYGFYTPYIQNQQQVSENLDTNTPQKTQDNLQNLNSSTQDAPQKLDKSSHQSRHKTYFNNSGEFRRNNSTHYHQQHQQYQQQQQYQHHASSQGHYHGNNNFSPQNYSHHHHQQYYQNNHDSHHHYNNNNFNNRREHSYDTHHQNAQYYEHSRQNKNYQNSRKPKLLYEEISKEENVQELKEKLEQERKEFEEKRNRFDEERKKYEEDVRRIELNKQKEEEQILKAKLEEEKHIAEEKATAAKILAAENQRLEEIRKIEQKRLEEQKREEEQKRQTILLQQQEQQKRKELEEKQKEEEKKSNQKKKEQERKKREKKQPSTKDVKTDQAYAKQLQEELNREAELKMKEEYARQQRLLTEQENQESSSSKLNSSSIIVSEIPYEVSEEKIKSTLATYGKLVNVEIKTVYSTLSTSITAYATYDSESSATKALKHFSGKKKVFPHQDRPLVAKYQLPEGVEPLKEHEKPSTVKTKEEEELPSLKSNNQNKKEEKHAQSTKKTTNAMYSVLEDLEETETSLSESVQQKTEEEQIDTNENSLNKTDKSKNKKKYQKQLKKQIKKAKQESKHKHHEKPSKTEEEETLNAFIAKAEEEKKKKEENLEKLRADPNNKYIPCKNYFSREGCPYGRNCPFSHDSVLKDQFKEQEKQKKLAQDIYGDLIQEAEEDSDFIDLEKEAEEVTEVKKSKLCLFYGSKEGCKFGDRCQFCHLDDKSIHEEYCIYCTGKNKSRFCQCSPYNAEPQCFDPKNMKLTKLQQRLMEKQGSKVLIESLGLFEMKPSDLRKHLYILKNASKEQHQNGNYWLLFPDTGVSMMLSKLDYKEGVVVKQHFEEEEKKKNSDTQKTGTIYDPDKDNETPVWNILGDAKHQTCILHYLETKLPLTFLPSSYEIEDHIYEKALWGTPDVKKDEDFPTILERINDNIIEDEESEESDEGDFMSARDAFMFMMMNSFFGRGEAHEGGNGKAYYCSNCGQWHYH